MPYLSAIVPAHNEESKIYYNLKKMDSVLKRILKGKTYEIIMVDDGSSDKTYSQALRAQKERKSIKVVRKKVNSGKGSALKYGFGFVKGQYVAFLDADLDLPPEQLVTFFDYMKKYKADVVVGSKRHPDSKIVYPLKRRILSSLYYFFVKVLFGLKITDTQVGLKLFKCNVLKNTMSKILCKRYAFDLELLVNINHLGYKIVGAPIVLKWQRPIGRIRIKDIWHIFLDTAAIFYRLNIIKYYDRGKDENSNI